MWSDLSQAWKVSFEQAWEAYCKGSIPIGAVVVNGDGNIVAAGRSMVNEKDAPAGRICWHKLSHAELNALLQVSHHDHKDIRSYTLYTTMESCPLCFGALVMSNVRNLKYAARDRVGGATNLYQASDFIKSKPLKISGSDRKLEEVQMVIKTDFVLRNWPDADRLLAFWKKDCPQAVRLGKRWSEEGRLFSAQQEGEGIDTIMDEIERSLHSNN